MGGAIGKLFTSIRNSMTKRPTVSKVGPSSKLKAPGLDESYSCESSFRPFVEHILDLSDSDLSIILSQVPPDDKIRLRQVCKKWSDLFHLSHMWKTMDLQPMFRSLNSEKMFVFCELGGETLQVLNLANCWQIMDDDLKNIAMACPNISSLSLSNCWKISDKGITYVAQGLTRLADLDLSYCGQLGFGGFAEHRMALLKKINFAYCKQLSDEHLEALLSKTTNVRWLSFRRCTRITDFGLFLVVRYCR
jgi:F-box and leucine-rich repeat protein GRR1